MSNAIRCRTDVIRGTSLLALALIARMASAQVMEIGDDGTARMVSTATVSEIAGPAADTDRMMTPLHPEITPLHWQSALRSIAAKYQISPALLSALIWQESRWRANAISPAGARGLTQLMPGTARDLGVDPDDPVQNLDGGARYLRLQLNRFGGDIEKALAAYNAGPGRVVAAGGVPAIAETRDYVQSILNALSQQAIND